MRQEIYSDPYGIESWDQDETSRCFVHLCNAGVWREISGTKPPHEPFTAAEYEWSGLPWFDYYRDDLEVHEGSKTLNAVKSVDSIASDKVVHCGPKKRPK